MAKIQRTIGKLQLVFDREWNEYVVKVWDIDGKRYNDADYHTCDKLDAQATFADMTMAMNNGRV